MDPRLVCMAPSISLCHSTNRRARTLERQLQQENSLWDVVSDYGAWALALGTLYGGNMLLADVRLLVALPHCVLLLRHACSQ